MFFKKNNIAILKANQRNPIFFCVVLPVEFHNKDENGKLNDLDVLKREKYIFKKFKEYYPQHSEFKMQGKTEIYPFSLSLVDGFGNTIQFNIFFSDCL